MEIGLLNGAFEFIYQEVSMAKTNSEMLTPDNTHNRAIAETENLNSVYEFREVLWETNIRPMRSPMFGQIRPDVTEPRSAPGRS